ncbi:uncharacterized abhydrolase domain-containing protein DDB_G0269086-like [Athalia rosae]|uniref:uncharacterized abhydrolase domain-containing protein DDB_G0269086-like n=1 Tax=Athalia rosae TaxID=37344 RepID=UPI0020343150|nr:uncharacterized abhydrolase domain-containing protein DDB_G0269086-like [Athalia rosae]
MKGSFDPGEVQRLEDEVRQCEKEEALRKIEEKHLSGLISYEESLLAKRQLIDEAREQGNAVRLEKEELNAKLEKYRVEEVEKLKRIVEKCHDNERAVKHSYALMVDEKRQKAAETAEESRRIKLYLMNQKEEELRRKLQLIKEIKTLQAIQGLHTKEFDPTEKSKLGLMCEMSLAELKEKLLRAKEKWRDELIARKDAVRERRQRQKDLVESAEKRISEYRVLKQISSPPASGEHNSNIALQTPQIQALRRKLEDRRMRRLQTTKSSSNNRPLQVKAND